MLIAHRGLYNEIYGENTIKAFDNAFNNGFEGIETDLRITKDNKIVCIHDSFISRVSNGSGLVKKQTLPELKQYDFKDKICSLEEIKKRYYHKIIFLELKEPIEINRYIDNRNTYYICSFNYRYISKLPKGNYKIGIINNVFNTNIDLTKIDFIMILCDLITDEIYEFYQSKNIEVVAYGLIFNKPKIKSEYLSKLKIIF